MYEAAPNAFHQFARMAALAEYRDKLPAGPFHVARLVATRDEDCGTCVQIVVNQAKQDGVEPELILTVLEQRPDDLPESLRDVYRFAEAVVTASGAEGQYRERLRQVFGEEGLVELAMAIAFCRVFPVTKRALGFAQSCAAVDVDV
jgi:alkylhydroperoxidase family enzyme